MPNIALVGKLCAGKDTVADLLVREHGYTRVAFADHLKDLAVNATDLIVCMMGLGGREEITRARLDADKEHFRTFLQWLGGDFVRGYLGRDTYWIDYILSETRTGGPYVLTDCRYFNEAETMREHGWEVVYVHATDDTRFDRYVGRTTMPVAEVATAWEQANAHSSEQDVSRIAISTATYVLNNDDEYDDLVSNVNQMMGEIG